MGYWGEAFWREEVCFVSRKRGGNKKESVLENTVNTESIGINNTKKQLYTTTGLMKIVCLQMFPGMLKL